MEDIHRKKILLINPGQLPGMGDDLSAGTIRSALFIPNFFSKLHLGLPLALPTIASVTPKKYTVRIVDEMVERINFNEKCDMVGITAMTFKSTRAYQIAAEFRKRNVPVIMGGIHASLCPDDASHHVDSIVIGEADYLWPRILEDFERGNLKPLYKVEGHPELTELPAPRYDVASHKKYLSFSLQTTRGCPYSCKFCTVTEFNGKALRRKSPEQIIKEVESILKLRKPTLTIIDKKHKGPRKRFAAHIFIADDNFTINRQHALDVCKALKKFQDEKGIFINWFTQGNYKTGLDDELLEAMGDAGCHNVFMGFESINPDTLKSLNKSMNNVENYVAAIDNMKRHGVEVYFSAFLGGDFDTINAGNELGEFVEKNDIFYLYPHMLTPFPGTVLREEMEQAGRILIKKHEYYFQRDVTFKPALMSPVELQKIHADLCVSTFDFDKLLARGKRLLKYPKRYYLASESRVIMWIGFSIAMILFVFQGRIRLKLLPKVLRAAYQLVLCNGSFTAVDVFACSIEFSIFARNEYLRTKIAETS